MLIKTWRLLTIVLVALSLAPALGHLLELPAKMAYDGTLWLTLQQTLYGAFGTVGAAFEVGAVITTVVLAFLVRHRRPAFGWTLLAAGCMVAMHAAFWIWLAPVNSTIAALSPEAPPANWMELRTQWEYTHAARAVIQIIALAALVFSILVEMPPDPFGQEPVDKGKKMQSARMSFLLATMLCFSAVHSDTNAQSTAQQTAPSTAAAASSTSEPLRSPDVLYVATPPEVVDAMLQVANARQGDVLYDLGSGDGRIPITSVQKYNVSRATGIDIDPERIKEAQANLKAAGLGDRVRFRNEDLFEADFSEATVVTLYLLPALNVKLLPKLLSDLKPGTRIVSHAFDMGDWKPEKTLDVGGRAVYFWTIPAKGTPAYAAAVAAAVGATKP